MNVRFSFFYDVILTRAEISENYGWFDRHSTDVSIVDRKNLVKLQEFNEDPG